ncbi:MAG: protein translocase subunit SecD [Longimicrobiales bacterium]
MSGNLVRRFAVIAIVLGLALFFLLKNGINYGLDIQGGMYLAVEVRDPEGTLTAQARRDATDQALQVIRNRIDQFGVAEPNVQKFGNERIIVELPGIDDEERAKNIIRQTAFLEFQNVLATTEFEGALPRIDREILRTIPGAARPGTPTDTAVVRRGPSPMDLLMGRDSARRDSTAAADTVKADTAAVSIKPEDRPLTSLLRASGQDGEFLVELDDKARVDTFLALPEVKRLYPRNTTLRWGADSTGQGATLYRSLFVLRENPFMLGDRVQGAQAGKDPQYNYTVVTFQLDRRGGRIFDRETSQNIGKRIAISLDQNVISAPTVQSRIASSGQIEMGNAPMTEARDLALVLRSGALPAEIEIIEQRSVGPTLGRDSIEQGRIAGLIGIVLIVIIMVAYYKFAGVLACLALVAYVLLVLGLLAAFPGATLTAPGIAGFLLSIGMGVDGNVLIFERIREEIAAGRNMRAAVDAGFQNAMGAIIDTHLVTLITALILFSMGTGPVQGFAVTLAIGILASFFSSVYVTRTLFLVYISRRSQTQPISI